mgnify:CR=1 FL=1
MTKKSGKNFSNAFFSKKSYVRDIHPDMDSETRGVGLSLWIDNFKIGEYLFEKNRVKVDTSNRRFSVVFA